MIGLRSYDYVPKNLYFAQRIFIWQTEFTTGFSFCMDVELIKKAFTLQKVARSKPFLVLFCTPRKPGSNIRVVFPDHFIFDPLRVTFDPIWIVLIPFSDQYLQMHQIHQDHFWSDFRIKVLIRISGSLWSGKDELIFDTGVRIKSYPFFLIFDPGLSKSDSRKCIHTIISPDLPTASRGRLVRAMVS